MPAGAGPLRADVAQFKAVLGKASELDAVLKRELRKNIRDAAKTVAKEVQADVRREPDHKSPTNIRSTGLRESLAKGVKVSIATGNTVGVTITAGGKLAKQYDGAKRWRHPVFGNRNAWVTQTGRRYFEPVVEANREIVTKAVEEAMKTAAEVMK